RRMHMCDRTRGVAREAYACGREVVKTMRVADVLHPGRIADAASHAFAVREVAESSREGDRVRWDLAVGHRDVSAPADDLGDGRAPLHRLTRDDAIAVAQGILLA